MKRPLYYREFSYDKSLLPNDWLRSKEEQTKDIDEALSQTGASVGWPGWSLLYSLTLGSFEPLQAGQVVETGTNMGASTVILAQALLDRRVAPAQVITFEKDPTLVARARRNFRDAGVDSVIYSVEGDTRDVLANVLAERVPKKSLRLVFLDGGHEKDLVNYEFDAIQDFLCDDGIVLFDNTYQIAEQTDAPRVNEFLTDLVESRTGNLVNVPYLSWYTPGMAIWQRAPFVPKLA